MKTYTIYAPEYDDRSFKERAMDYQFIKEGFSLWALLFGPFWLAIKGMWLELLTYCAIAVGLSLGLQLLGFNAEAISGATFIANIIFAIFARDIERLHLERDGFQMVSIINGKTKEDCEASFFRNHEKSENTKIEIVELIENTDQFKEEEIEQEAQTT